MNIDNKFIVINLLHYVTDNVMGLQVEKITNKLIELKQKNSHFLICHFFENHCWGKDGDSDLILLKNLREILKANNIEYHFLFDALYEGLHRIDYTDDIIFINYGMLLTYDFIFLKNNKFNTKWDPNKQKGLFLCGKGSKPNRAYLLRRLYEEKLLDNFTWSFNNNSIELEVIKRSLEFSDYNDEQWNKFIIDCTRNLDLPQSHINHFDFFSHNGFPVDVSLYENTLYSLVSETLFTSEVGLFRLGEKTWRTMVNHHPFLIAACPKSLIQLRKMGFRTFDNYATTTIYDYVLEGNERLELIVENTKSFMTQLHNNQTEVNKDIKHNYHKLLEYCRLYADRLTKTLDCSENIISQIIYKFQLPEYQ